MNGVDLIFDESAKSVLLRLDLDTARITHQDVMQHLAAAGYSHFLVHPQEIDSALALRESTVLSATQAPGALAPTTRENAFLAPIRIAECRDAGIEVLLDASRLAATLRITAPWGGVPATMPACEAALLAANVTYGVDNAALNALVLQAATLDHGTTIEAVVARGTPAEQGADSTFEVLVPTLKDRVLHPLESADGSVDFHELGDIPVVKAGAALMRRLPPGPGSVGVTVCNEPIPTQPGQSISFTVGLGTLVSPGDGNLLVAQFAGMPAQLPGGMSVEQIFRTQEVSVATGNVSFGGSILVDLDVKTGFSVCADSDVNIGGIVESARVIAGNDVIIASGISGNLGVKGAMPSACISAGNTLCAGFAQFAELHANVGVAVAQFLLHCHVTSFDWIKLGGDAPGKSKMIGGSARALSFIKLDTLGSPDGTHTVVELTGNFARLSRERETLEKRIVEREHQLAQVDVIMATLKAKTRFPRHLEMTQRAHSAHRNLSADLQQTKQKLSDWEHKHRQACECVCVVITRKAYAGSEIIIGDKRILLTEDWGAGTIQYGSAGLVLQRGNITQGKRQQIPPVSEV